MKKGLIWGTGTIFNDTICAIKYHESKGKFKITGVTSKDLVKIYSHILDYKCIQKEEINPANYGFVVITAEDNIYHEIANEALKLGFKKEQLMMSRIFKNPLFDINKYLEILKSAPTLFSNNCWAGITYNKMCLPFNSPTINMWFDDNDYIKFLKNPELYLDKEPEFYKIAYDTYLHRNYPICKLEDIILNFNHYSNYEDAKNCWERRKKRINWDNIIVMMYTQNHEIEIEFSKLPYEKKFCFVPYETNINSSVYIDFNIPECKYFWQVMDKIAKNFLQYYDPFDLLIKGFPEKIVKTIA